MEQLDLFTLDNAFNYGIFKETLALEGKLHLQEENEECSWIF